MIVELAPAKLNLALHVRSRRPDGYHDIETLFAFVADGDVITVTAADRWSLRIDGPFAAGLTDGDDNLVTRATRAFAERFGGGEGYAVTLAKNLPVASGIGGGSADAAAMLRALARLNDVAVNDPALFDCADRLGSDVPACLLGRPAVGAGRGEQLREVSGLPGLPVLLVNPRVGVATPAVFGNWDRQDRGPLPAGDAATMLRTGRNDLQAPAIATAPIIAAVLSALEAADGVLTARMSGSGATCFGAFSDRATRDHAAKQLTIARPEWWTLATALT